jgi:cephalosporin-C deacetylase-like acetyl esterase
MAGWLYPAVSPRGSSAKKGPAIVLAHGLGGVKEMRLDAYAEKFSSLGYICVVFDYRNSGSSTGKPAGLVHVPRQLEDWRVAIEYTRKLENVDLTRIGIFGTSFGGGNVIRVAAADPSIKAVISQCPFTDGFHSTLTVGWKVLPSLVYLALKDLLFGTDDDPVTVPLIGEPNSGETYFIS